MKTNERSLQNLKPFTSENHPRNGGRKPSLLKKYIKETNISREDVGLMIKSVLFAKSYEELKLLLSDPYQPMIIRLFIKAYLNDFNNGGLVNFSVLMDRAFGAPKQDVNISGTITVETMSFEERERLINEYIARRNQGDMQGGDEIKGECEDVSSVDTKG